VTTTNSPPIRLAVVGAGPVGLALALHAARTLPGTSVTVFDARAESQDVARDPRTLALSLGSVQWLKRLNAFDATQAQPIAQVHVSQAPPAPHTPLGEPEVVLKAIDEAVPMLGAVMSYGAVVAPLQSAWLAEAARAPERLLMRWATPVKSLETTGSGVSLGIEGGHEAFDLAVVAEGGVFAEQARKSITAPYGQTAWVGQVVLEGAPAATAFERFTRHGPAALLPLKDAGDGRRRAALVWCVPSDDDPVRELSAAQRLAVLNTVFPAAAGRLVELTPLKAFPLGLNAERTLTSGRCVRIGNAAQTLHPVAGQGLNLGLRDAHELVAALKGSASIEAALRRLEWRRAPDRWSMIAATDFLARSFTWKAPGLAAARALGLAALQAAGPVKSALARQMMFGRR